MHSMENSFNFLARFLLHCTYLAKPQTQSNSTLLLISACNLAAEHSKREKSNNWVAWTHFRFITRIANGYPILRVSCSSFQDGYSKHSPLSLWNLQHLLLSHSQLTDSLSNILSKRKCKWTSTTLPCYHQFHQSVSKTPIIVSFLLKWS